MALKSLTASYGGRSAIPATSGERLEMVGGFGINFSAHQFHTGKQLELYPVLAMMKNICMTYILLSDISLCRVICCWLLISV